MTIFVVALFLPYTVNFNTTAVHAQHLRPPSPQVHRPQTAPGRRALSLLAYAPGKIVQTPGATTDHEQIFTPSVPSKPFKLSLPAQVKEEKEQDDNNDRAATLNGLRDPRLLPRIDLHAPIWGSLTSLNQPVSRAKSPPPASILKHNATITSTGSLLWKHRYRARTASHERQFSESNYSIERAQHGNGGLFNAIDAVSASGALKEKTWVGTLGMPTDALNDHLKESISERLEDDYEALTVYIDDGDFDGHYERYCKTILWPIFHYQIPDHPKSKAYEDHSWIYYVKVNQAFADRIIKNYKKGDIIWIHDYHLLLVAGMLRAKLPDAEIGFFMHTAFPSSEIFRCLATRTDLLEGLLGANMIGFQNEEYGHHFLQTCSRLLVVEATKYGVLLEDGRYVHVNTFPIGLDPLGFEERRSLPEVSEWIQQIAKKYQGKRIIVARDQLDSIRGVRQKILSYELFLNRYPAYKEDVVLIQIATSTTEDPELSASVADIVTRVNSTHSTLSHQPLVYLRQDIDHSQYLALCTVAEALVVTSLREGMNLTSHEYIYCQDGKYSNNKWNPLILSEFTGSATILGHDAILINPWDYREVADSIRMALDMSLEEKEARWKAMYSTVTSQTAAKWYSSFMEALEHAYVEHSVRDSTAVPRLSFPALKSKYDAAEGRLLVLDYEGTLASWGAPNSIILTTPQRAIDVLNTLVEDTRNTVYVMSSRSPEELERLFRLVPTLGLIAENGAFLREAGADDWIELFDVKHVKSWKPGVRQILQYYVERIEGSRLEERESALIFDYSSSKEAASATKLAGECANHLNDACHNQNIQAIPIENGLCISGDINKGTACRMISDKLDLTATSESGGLAVDFLLVIGDSREDEYAFSWAQELEGKKARDVCTVTLGTRSTSASATLTQGVTGVLSTLRKLAMS